uniref:Uncharacterized protein n=1 Tax=Romanomermis culicivorax TaxID=13658 RepID=A0A915KXC4_ROMCU
HGRISKNTRFKLGTLRSNFSTKTLPKNPVDPNGTEWDAIDATLLNERKIFVPFGDYHRSFFRKLQLSSAIGSFSGNVVLKKYNIKRDDPEKNYAQQQLEKLQTK